MKMFAIAEFESICRGRSDEHSDRDLLVVCDSDQRYRLVDRYKSEGYSVCALSPSQLLYMQQRGSLFVQHVRHEGRIRLDLDGAFSRWLNSCALIPPAKTEIQRCRATIEFISTWPDDPRIEGWRADFLYCVSRDLLIKSLAGCGILAFGLEDLEKGLGSIWRANFGGLANLAGLREAKVAYRDGRPVPNGTSITIAAWLKELTELFRLSSPNPLDSQAEVLIHNLATRNFSSNYERLRSLEVAYLVARCNNITHAQHTLLMKHITSPNGYSSSQAGKRGVIERYLSEVLEMLANQSLEPTRDSLSIKSGRLRRAAQLRR